MGFLKGTSKEKYIHEHHWVCSKRIRQPKMTIVLTRKVDMVFFSHASKIQESAIQGLCDGLIVIGILHLLCYPEDMAAAPQPKMVA